MAPMAMMKIEPVVTSVSMTASFTFSSVRVRCAKPMTNARKAPTPPASVGVKMPPNRPPNTPTIRASTGQVLRNEAKRSPQVTSCFSLGASSGLIFTRTMIMTPYRRAVSRPGATPAMNSLLIGSWA